MRILAMAVLLATASGCTGCFALPNVTVLGKDCTFGMQHPLERMAVVGESMTLAAGQQVTCQRSLVPQAKKAAVTVTDPSGTAVAFTVSNVTHAAPWTNEVEVTFTPSVAGAHTVTVAFDPATAGTVAYEVQAVTKRTEAAGQVIPWDGPADCLNFALSPKGTLACVRRIPSSNPAVLPDPELRTHRGQTFGGLAFALRGDVLWRLSSQGTLERRLDDGTAYQPTHQAAAPSATGPMAIIGDDAWIIAGPTSLLKAHPEADGTLTLTAIPRPNAPAQGIAGDARGVMIWSDGPISGRPTFYVVAPDGKVEARALAGGTEAHGLVGWEEDTVWAGYSEWTKEDPTTRRHIAALTLSGTGGEPVAEARAEFTPYNELRPPDPVLGFFPPTTPLMRAATHPGQPPREPVVLPKRVAGKLVFETFEVGDGYGQLHSATRTHAFSVAQDGKSVKVFTRN